MLVTFLKDYKGTETNPADYKKGDEVELSADMAWQLAMLGVVHFETPADPEIKQAKKEAKEAKRGK